MEHDGETCNECLQPIGATCHADPSPTPPSISYYQSFQLVRPDGRAISRLYESFTTDQNLDNGDCLSFAISHSNRASSNIPAQPGPGPQSASGLLVPRRAASGANALDLTIGVLGQGNSAGLRQVFQPNSHIHAVALDCAVFLFEHISQVYADAEQHPAAFRQVRRDLSPKSTLI